MKILVLGITGMLGSEVFSGLSINSHYEVWGTMRHKDGINYFDESLHANCITGIDVLDHDVLIALISKIRPNVIINCVGLIKQLPGANNPIYALPINALLPHRLANLCGLSGIRLIHISTDCVFSGKKGMYIEEDISDAEDLYGKSKYIGELHDCAHAVTLRTSIIGHSLTNQFALVDWFLSQKGSVKGYKKAIFSGLPTVELVNVIKDYVIPDNRMKGLYHVSVMPIDKYSLLKLIANIYDKDINIIPDEKLKIDRSLDSSKFQKISGYTPPKWEELINKMRCYGFRGCAHNA